MNHIRLIDELRAIRQRLAQQQEFDVERYAAMLRLVGQLSPGCYVVESLQSAGHTAVDVGWLSGEQPRCSA